MFLMDDLCAALVLCFDICGVGGFGGGLDCKERTVDLADVVQLYAQVLRLRPRCHHCQLHRLLLSGSVHSPGRLRTSLSRTAKTTFVRSLGNGFCADCIISMQRNLVCNIRQAALDVALCVAVSRYRTSHGR